MTAAIARYSPVEIRAPHIEELCSSPTAIEAVLEYAPHDLQMIYALLRATLTEANARLAFHMHLDRNSGHFQDFFAAASTLLDITAPSIIDAGWEIFLLNVRLRLQRQFPDCSDWTVKVPGPGLPIHVIANTVDQLLYEIDDEMPDRDVELVLLNGLPALVVDGSTDESRTFIIRGGRPSSAVEVRDGRTSVDQDEHLF